LAGIILHASASLRWLAVDPPDLDEVRSAAQRTIRDAQRTVDVISRLRGLFMKRSGAHEALDLNEAIREVVALTQNEVHNSGATLRLELTGNLPPVVGDRVLLQQVVVNLITNAIQAMSSVENRPRELVLRTADSSDQAQVSVRDSGVGLESTN